MATTYTLITSAVVGSGGVTDIEFTSIPQTYTDLLLLTSLRDDRNISLNDGILSFNGSNSDFSRIYLETTNSATPTSDIQANNNLVYATTAQATSSTFSSTQIHISNYTSSNNKPISMDHIILSNGTPSNLGFFTGLWSNSSAITSLKISPSGSGIKYVQHSTAYLYGIKNS
jgi:hypothetical protein